MLESTTREQRYDAALHVIRLNFYDRGGSDILCESPKCALVVPSLCRRSSQRPKRAIVETSDIPGPARGSNWNTELGTALPPPGFRCGADALSHCNAKVWRHRTQSSRSIGPGTRATHRGDCPKGEAVHLMRLRTRSLDGVLEDGRPQRGPR